MRVIAAVSAFALLVALPAMAAPDSPGDGEAAFRALFKELVETNTQPSNGDCTVAARRMVARLKDAGYSDADARVFVTPDHPKEGGLIAVLKGTDTKSKGVLLLAHIDVVEAKREDWTRDPFTLVEENGQFYARGVADDKGQAAIFTDLMARFKLEGYKPRRTVKLALTCGEETDGMFNGAKWLSQEHKDWIDADFALNEGAYGKSDAQGRKVSLDIEAAEKVYQDFTFEATNSGGHSSRPRPDNAITEMSVALKRAADYEFPVMVNDATRGYFTQMARIEGGENGAAMLKIVADPSDVAANALLSKNVMWHSMLRTTCVATMISGGHAVNALPQDVKANVNCRIFPGTPVDTVRQALVGAVGDAKVTVTPFGETSPATPAPKLGPDILGPIVKASAEVYPGVPVIPTMETGASDGIYTTAAGIPTYGLYGFFEGEDEGNIHGLNEHVSVQSLMDGRRFTYKLVKMYLDRK